MEEISCGIDIGGAKLTVALVGADGRIVERSETSGHVGMPERPTVALAADMLRGLLARRGMPERGLLGIGVGMAGHIRFPQGIVITTSNLRGYRDFPLKAEFERHFRLPVIVDNDANCQAWGEYRFGAGHGQPSMIFITVSTGIGAGIIIDGRLYRGATGTAGELGHTIVEPHSDIRCTCGNYGCLMSHACTLCLSELARKKAAAGVVTCLDLSSEESCADIDGRLVGENAARGDALCMEIIRDCADYLGIAIYNIFQIFNPHMIVLGGGLMNWGFGYFERILDKFHVLAGNMLYDPIQIVRSRIGQDVGVIGAAALAQEKR